MILTNPALLLSLGLENRVFKLTNKRSEINHWMTNVKGNSQIILNALGSVFIEQIFNSTRNMVEEPYIVFT